MPKAERSCSHGYMQTLI